MTAWISNYDAYVGDVGQFGVDVEEFTIHPNYGADNEISNDVCLLRVPTLSEQKPGFKRK